MHPGVLSRDLGLTNGRFAHKKASGLTRSGVFALAEIAASRFALLAMTDIRGTTRSAGLSDASGALKSSRCLAVVGLFEGRAEVAVAGKSEVECEAGQIGLVAEQVERSGEAELEVAAIERQTFDLLEYLREIDRRDADVDGDFGQGPTALRIG